MARAKGLLAQEKRVMKLLEGGGVVNHTLDTLADAMIRGAEGKIHIQGHYHSQSGTQCGVCALGAILCGLGCGFKTHNGYELANDGLMDVLPEVVLTRAGIGHEMQRKIFAFNDNHECTIEEIAAKLRRGDFGQLTDVKVST